MKKMKYFFVGWHQPRNGPSGCGGFELCMVSVNRLLGRRSSFPVNSWILDSGAFTRIQKKGHLSVKRYAAEIMKWGDNGTMMAAVAQDYICEPSILEITGLTINQHQWLTIHRYRRLLSELKAISHHHPYLMPVLQGFEPGEYVDHLRCYGPLIESGAWVGVGSVCRRQANPAIIVAILSAIHAVRPDLKLHGFGVKRKSLEIPEIWDLLYSADSLAPSYHSRLNPHKGRSSNDPLVAAEYARSIRPPEQLSIFARSCDRSYGG